LIASTTLPRPAAGRHPRGNRDLEEGDGLRHRLLPQPYGFEGNAERLGAASLSPRRFRSPGHQPDPEICVQPDRPGQYPASEPRSPAWEPPWALLSRAQPFCDEAGGTFRATKDHSGADCLGSAGSGAGASVPPRSGEGRAAHSAYAAIRSFWPNTHHLSTESPGRTASLSDASSERPGA
jgi:putative hemolysin